MVSRVVCREVDLVALHGVLVAVFRKLVNLLHALLLQLLIRHVVVLLGHADVEDHDLVAVVRRGACGGFGCYAAVWDDDGVVLRVDDLEIAVGDGKTPRAVLRAERLLGVMVRGLELTPLQRAAVEMQ